MKVLYGNACNLSHNEEGWHKSMELNCLSTILQAGSGSYAYIIKMLCFSQINQYRKERVIHKSFLPLHLTHKLQTLTVYAISYTKPIANHHNHWLIVNISILNSYSHPEPQRQICPRHQTDLLYYSASSFIRNWIIRVQSKLYTQHSLIIHKLIYCMVQLFSYFNLPPPYFTSVCVFISVYGLIIMTNCLCEWLSATIQF